jgi:hypothetical protein
MTTLKITFYKNIKSVLVLVNHNFLILGGKVEGGGVNLMASFQGLSQRGINEKSVYTWMVRETTWT